MAKPRGMMRLRAVFALALGLAAGAVSANELLKARLADVLGAEQRAIEIVPSSALAALARRPVPSNARSVGSFEYSDDYLRSLPRATGGPEFQCLTEALYHEARGESVRGLFAVGEVILNRRDSSRWPSTACGVIHQGTGRKFACQFTYTCDGRPETFGDPIAHARVARVARLLLDGADRKLTAGATYYHAKWVTPSWARGFRRTASIGVHHFYRP